MSLETVEDLLYHGMKDLLSAEKQFRDALPKLAEAAEADDLAQAFRDHHEETLEHIGRLERGFELLGRAERSEKCEAADGLTKEGEEVIDEDGEAPAKDVLLIAAGRKVEHYEIASYEDAVRWAKALGKSDIADLLQSTLDEERAADEKLEDLARRLTDANAQGVV